MHANPRAAKACSQCGSTDLSTPHPRLPLLLRIVGLVLNPLTVLIALVVYAGFYVHRLFTDPNGLLPLMCLGFGLGLLLYLWMLVPRGVRSGVKRFMGGKGKDIHSR